MDMQNAPNPDVVVLAAPADRPGRRSRRPGFARALPYLMLVPAALIFAIVLGYPLVRLGVISAQNYGLHALFSGKVTWAGFANYRSIVDGGQIGGVLLRTFGFCAALVVGTLAIGLVVALMMRCLGSRLRTLVTLCLITAWAMPTVTSTLVWQWLFEPLYGVLNWLITQLHVFGDYTQHDWLQSPTSAFFLVWLLVVWQSVPFVALTLYAAASQIPESYYEAAYVDGGSPWQVFRMVTMPFLRPIMLLIAILSVIWDFNVFNQIWILTQGGPAGGTTTLGIWSFTKAFSNNSFGEGAAIAVFAVALLMVTTAFYVRRLVRSGEEW
jgi:N,N'-diacetylchitobiose transport system permease protein